MTIEQTFRTPEEIERKLEELMREIEVNDIWYPGGRGPSIQFPSILHKINILTASINAILWACGKRDTL